MGCEAGVRGMTDRAELLARFVAASGWSDARASVIAGDASNREYQRLETPDGKTAILMNAPPDKGEDVRPFVRIAQHLIQQGISAPDIYEQDHDNGFLLIEDLGDGLFYDLMAQDSAQQVPLYQAACDLLIHLRTTPTLPLETCDVDWLSRATDMFFEWYPLANPQTAARDFMDAFKSALGPLDTEDRSVILRDFHAQNLLWLPERKGIARVGVLDFQDALLGHPAYDLVSVLQDARRDVPASIEAQMIAYYTDHAACDPSAFRTAYALLGLQRNLRILGIFARLTVRDGKPGYADMIPRVHAYVLRNLRHPELAVLGEILLPHLPTPDARFLNNLRARCPANPQP